jgi:hypothetical protein
LLPIGKKSLVEIGHLYDPADRLTNAATLLEYSLVQLAPGFRQADGSAPSLSDRLRSLQGQVPDVGSILRAVQVRNRVVHAQGTMVTKGEIESAGPILLGAVAALLPSLAPNVAQAISGAQAATAQPRVQAPAVNFRGLIFSHDEQGAAGQFGMSLLITFTAISMRGQTGIILLHFLDWIGFPLPDKDGNYRNVRGEVARSERFIPQSDKIDFMLFPMFMEYHQLHLTEGRHIIRVRASAYLIEGQQSTLLSESSEVSCSIIRTGDYYMAGAAR